MDKKGNSQLWKKVGSLIIYKLLNFLSLPWCC